MTMLPKSNNKSGCQLKIAPLVCWASLAFADHRELFVVSIPVCARTDFGLKKEASSFQKFTICGYWNCKLVSFIAQRG